MRSNHVEDLNTTARPSQSSSETDVPQALDEKHAVPQDSRKQDEDGLEKLNYPEPWKLEKWFVGGYSQKRMIKFKKPKNMYRAINLFAGMSMKLLLIFYSSCLSSHGLHRLTLHP